MSDIVIGGWSYTWRTDLGYASVRSPDIRPPPQTTSYTYWPTDDDAERRNVLPKSSFVINKASSSVLLCLNHNHEGEIEKVV